MYIDHIDLVKLNSLTKYPSIPTYHKLDEKGKVTEEVVIPFEDQELIVTEKIDGTNCRVIVLPDDSFLIGSRNELLHFKGDLLWNPSQGIVEALKVVSGVLPRICDGITVFYFELFGNKIGRHAKQYSGEGNIGFCLFDVLLIIDPDKNLSLSLEDIAVNREILKPHIFLDEGKLEIISKSFCLNLAPRICTINSLPKSIEGAKETLEKLMPETRVALDEKALKQPEGIVIRDKYRTRIAKIRFEDYSPPKSFYPVHAARMKPNRADNYSAGTLT